MEWFIGITGKESDLNELSKSINTKDLCISKHRDRYILKYSAFSQCANPTEVRKIAANILKTVNGAARLRLNIAKSIEISGVEGRGDDGSVVINPEPVICYVSVALGHMIIRNADGSVKKSFSPANTVLEDIKIAQRDERVARVLEILDYDGKSWSGLYKIFEVINEDVKQNCIENGLPKTKLNNLNALQIITV